MISIDVLVRDSVGLDRTELDHWIENDWIRADVSTGVRQFEEIDVARVRLIQELRDDFGVNDDSLPVVLLLLDQVYDLRRHLMTLRLEKSIRRADASRLDISPLPIRRPL